MKNYFSKICQFSMLLLCSFTAITQPTLPYDSTKIYSLKKNNFSEVNTELIDELKNELNSGNKEEAISIADDIKENEEKINHHGRQGTGLGLSLNDIIKAHGGEINVETKEGEGAEFVIQLPV